MGFQGRRHSAVYLLKLSASFLQSDNESNSGNDVAIAIPLSDSDRLASLMPRFHRARAISQSTHFLAISLLLSLSGNGPKPYT